MYGRLPANCGPVGPTRGFVANVRNFRATPPCPLFLSPRGPTPPSGFLSLAAVRSPRRDLPGFAGSLYGWGLPGDLAPLSLRSLSDLPTGIRALFDLLPGSVARSSPVGIWRGSSSPPPPPHCEAPLPIACLASPRALSVAPAPCPTKCRADSGALRGHGFFPSPPCHTLGSVQPYDSCVLRAGDGGDGAVEGAAEAAPVVHSKRRLRLFGVNLECAPDLEEAPQTARSVFGLVNQTACKPTPSAPYYWCCIAVQGENRVTVLRTLQARIKSRCHRIQQLMQRFVVQKQKPPFKWLLQRQEIVISMFMQGVN
ncbi:uncharacterized protein LOC109728311 [Ananas comosus]|uniref:Uncharacterized protein LOC109728311 n=1 Tax=Ananas comosus TaxID=4615 RepID=A0A6P5HHV9_ANACO|nr:uncharacterized protein LOC109728311 [Ananas comosus]